MSLKSVRKFFDEGFHERQVNISIPNEVRSRILYLGVDIIELFLFRIIFQYLSNSQLSFSIQQAEDIVLQKLAFVFDKKFLTSQKS